MRDQERSASRYTKRSPDQVASIAQFVVHETLGKSECADAALRHIGGDARGSLRPGDPESASGVERGTEDGEPTLEAGVRVEERDYDIDRSASLAAHRHADGQLAEKRDEMLRSVDDGEP